MTIDISIDLSKANSLPILMQLELLMADQVSELFCAHAVVSLNESAVLEFSGPMYLINLRTCSRWNTCLKRLLFTHHRLNSCNYHFGNIGRKHSQWYKQGQQTCCKQEVYFHSEYYFKVLYMMLITSALLMVFFGENLFRSVAPMIPLT